MNLTNRTTVICGGRALKDQFNRLCLGRDVNIVLLSPPRSDQGFHPAEAPGPGGLRLSVRRGGGSGWFEPHPGSTASSATPRCGRVAC